MIQASGQNGQEDKNDKSTRDRHWNIWIKSEVPILQVLHRLIKNYKMSTKIIQISNQSESESHPRPLLLELDRNLCSNLSISVAVCVVGSHNSKFSSSSLPVPVRAMSMWSGRRSRSCRTEGFWEIFSFCQSKKKKEKCRQIYLTWLDNDRELLVINQCRGILSKWVWTVTIWGRNQIASVNFNGK